MYRLVFLMWKKYVYYVNLGDRKMFLHYDYELILLQIFDTNVKASFFLVKEVVPHIEARG